MKRKVLIAGQEGMVGSAVYNLIKKDKSFKIIDCLRKDLDFTNIKVLEKWFKKNKPNIVINCAGKVGGILDNSKYQDQYLFNNTLIGLNLVNVSFRFNVKKLINLGSACIYPKKTKQPIKENYLLSSNLEVTNEGYALAKISTLKYCEYLKNKFNKDFISLQPANLYGEGDNFDLKSSHVIPALVKKFFIAKKNNHNKVEIWGSGNALREFIHVDDMADGIVHILEHYKNETEINLGSGEEISIKNLVELMSKVINYNGKIKYNAEKPEGVKRKFLDSSKIRKLGWTPKVNLEEGIKKMYEKHFK